MIIIKIETNKKAFLNLLLLADPEENMINKYLEQGDMFALYDGDLRSICVVCSVSDYEYEIKNLATSEEYQRQGYARKLLEYIAGYYKGKAKALILGTGEASNILSFYYKCGFTYSHRVVNFFTDNYSQPIYEDGILLRDMIYLRKLI
jgi:GNAT superfamily N-acetyltransferase